MDLSGPGSELSDDALSLRSRSIPGFNETVSPTPPAPPSLMPPVNWLVNFGNQTHQRRTRKFTQFSHPSATVRLGDVCVCGSDAKRRASVCMLISPQRSLQRASEQLAGCEQVERVDGQCAESLFVSLPYLH